MQTKAVASENWVEQKEESRHKTKRAMKDCKTPDVSSSRENPI
jgi:hypothetical protein